MLYILLRDVTHSLGLNTKCKWLLNLYLTPDFSPNHQTYMHILFPGHLPLATHRLNNAILSLSVWGSLIWRTKMKLTGAKIIHSKICYNEKLTWELYTIGKFKNCKKCFRKILGLAKKKSKLLLTIAMAANGKKYYCLCIDEKWKNW